MRYFESMLKLAIADAALLYLLNVPGICFCNQEEVCIIDQSGGHIEGNLP